MNLAFLEGAGRAGLDDFRINDMKNRGVDRDRPQVVFGTPDSLSLADGSYNIAYVFTEYDRFSARAAREMNRMDEVWVTSEFQREAARDSGVDREIVVMPLGVDPEYLSPRIDGYPLEGRFAFMAPVDWGPSLASETLLRAFTDEFAVNENAVLVVVARSPGWDERPGLPAGRGTGEPGKEPGGHDGPGIRFIILVVRRRRGMVLRVLFRTWKRRIGPGVAIPGQGHARGPGGEYLERGQGDAALADLLAVQKKGRIQGLGGHASGAQFQKQMPCRDSWILDDQVAVRAIAKNIGAVVDNGLGPGMGAGQKTQDVSVFGLGHGHFDQYQSVWPMSVISRGARPAAQPEPLRSRRFRREYSTRWQAPGPGHRSGHPSPRCVA